MHSTNNQTISNDVTCVLKVKKTPLSKYFTWLLKKNSSAQLQTTRSVHEQAGYISRHELALRQKQVTTKGFSLIELLVCLAILAIVSMLQMSSVSHVISSIQAQSELDSLHAFLKNSRKHALLNKQNIHLCSLKNHRCETHLGSRLSSFIDLNNDKNWDRNSEKIILQHNFKSSNSSLHSGNLEFLNINYLGMNNHLGSLYYCFTKGDYTFSKKISASMQGRFKVYDVDSSACQ